MRRKERVETCEAFPLNGRGNWLAILEAKLRGRSSAGESFTWNISQMNSMDLRSASGELPASLTLGAAGDCRDARGVAWTAPGAGQRAVKAREKPMGRRAIYVLKPAGVRLAGAAGKKGDWGSQEV